MSTWRSQFKEWLKEIIPWGQIENYVQFEGDYPKDWKLKKESINVNKERAYDENRIGVRIFTKDNIYQIGAKETYLGCIVSRRKPRAGESWTRGSDLPDGKFKRETWESIKNAIVRFEFVKVAKPYKPPLSPEGEMPNEEGISLK